MFVFLGGGKGINSHSLQMSGGHDQAGHSEGAGEKGKIQKGRGGGGLMKMKFGEHLPYGG